MMIGDKLLLISMIVIPLLIMVVSGYALQYEKLDVVTVAAVDEDGTEYSALLLDRLAVKEGIELHRVSREEGLKMLESSKVEQVFAIKDGFEASVKDGQENGLIDLLSSPASYSSGFAREIIAGEVIRLLMIHRAANDVVKQYDELGIKMEGSFRDEVAAYADSLWEPEPLMTIDYKVLKAGIVSEEARMTRPVASASSAGLLTAFIMFYILFGSGWLIEERTNGTMKRLGTTNGAIAASFGGSMLALLAAGALQIIVFCMVQKLFFGLDLFTEPLSYLILFVYLAAVVGVSMLLSAVLKTSAQLQAVAPVMAMFTGFVGGCFWNAMELPESIMKLSLITPQGWALKGINSLTVNPADSAAAWAPLLVLSATALILLSVSYMIMTRGKEDHSIS